MSRLHFGSLLVVGMLVGSGCKTAKEPGRVNGLDQLCVRVSCTSLQKNCGSVSDGCGGTLNCGTCGAGTICGGSGTPNVCGCVPTSCVALGFNCGAAPDGCGGTLNCGSCATGQTCGGGGQPNICACPRRTCAASGFSCGSAPDGCGGTLSCGRCPDGQSCGGGGTPNVCGTPQTDRGIARWARRFGGPGGDFVKDLAVSSSGSIFMVSASTEAGADLGGQTPSEGLTVINKYGPSGEHRWSLTPAPRSTSMANPNLQIYASPADDLLISSAVTGSVSPQFGGGPARGQFLVKLNSQGDWVWQSRISSTTLSKPVADSAGNIFLGGSTSLVCRTNCEWLYKHEPAGNQIWSNVVDFFRAASMPLAVDANGKLIAGISGRGSIQRHAFHENAPVLVKFAENGAFLWGSEISGLAGSFNSIAVSPDGSIVAAGIINSGQGTWAGQTLRRQPGSDPAPFFVIANPDGSPRWGAMLDALQGNASVSGDARGFVIAGTKSSSRQTAVYDYSWNGELIWSRTFQGDASVGNFRPRVVLAPNRSLVVGGGFSGTVDYGTGQLTARGESDIFLLNLAR